MLDTGRRIATPEGIELSLRLAGPVPRALAWTMDLMIRLAILLVASLALSQLGNFGAGLFFLGWFMLEWLFPAWCEVAWGGATPGKKAMGLVVLHDDGTPVRWPAALTRNLLRAIDFLPLCYGFGLVAMLANRDFKRLGDLVAGTVVAYREEKLRGFRIPPAPPLAPPAALTLAEQRAVLDFEDAVVRVVASPRAPDAGRLSARRA